MRAFCFEYGIPMRTGAGVFKLDLPRVLADEGNDLTPAMRSVLHQLWNQLKQIEEHIGSLTREVAAIAHRSDVARRLVCTNCGRG